MTKQPISPKEIQAIDERAYTYGLQQVVFYENKSATAV